LTGILLLVYHDLSQLRNLLYKGEIKLFKTSRDSQHMTSPSLKFTFSLLTVCWSISAELFLVLPPHSIHSQVSLCSLQDGIPITHQMYHPIGARHLVISASGKQWN